MIKNLFKGFLISFLLSLQSTHTFAQWSFDPKVCVPVSKAVQAQINPKILGGTGGYFVVWEDQRNGNFDIYAQYYNLSGTPQWALDGIPLCTAPGDQVAPSIASDGSGGAYISWTNAAPAIAQIQLVRITPAGSFAPGWNACGMQVSSASGGIGCRNSKVINIGADAFVAWEDNSPNSTWDIRCRLIANNATSAVSWGTTPLVVSGTFTLVTLDDVLVDPGNNAILVWTEELSVIDQNVMSSSISTTRTLNWGSPKAVANGTGIQSKGKVMFSGVSGNLIYTWLDQGASPVSVMAGSLNTVNGFAYWSPIKVSGLSGTEGPPQLVESAGDAIVTFHSNDGGTYDIYAQKISNAGTRLWSTDTKVSIAPGNQQNPVITTDGTNGAIIGWTDLRSGTADVFSQAITSTGATRWMPDGVPVCNAPGAQSAPAIVSNGVNGAVLTWVDGRIAPSDLYINDVDPDGNLPNFTTSPVNGPVGASVTLTGTNFEGVGLDSVMLNGVTVGSFSTDCPVPCSSITFSIPLSTPAGTWPIEVFNRTGKNLLLVNYTVDANTITTDPVTGPFCENANIAVTFNASGSFNTGNTYVAELSDASGNFSTPYPIGSIASNSLTGSIASTLPAGVNGTGYLIRVVSDNPAVQGTDNGTIFTINPTPATSAITGPGTVCENTSASAYSVTATGSTYAWTITGGTQVSGTNTNSITVNWGTAGAGNVSVTETSSAGCVGPVVNLPVTITSSATANAGSDQTVCADIVTVSLNGSVGGSATTGSWTGGAGSFSPGNTSLVTNYTPTLAEKIGGTVTLTLSTTNGCGSFSDNITILFTPAPTVNAGPDQTICAGSTAALSGSVTVATGVIWTGGSGTFTSATSTNTAYNPSGGETSGTITLTITSSGNGSCNAVSDDVILTINPIPAPPTATGDNICDNNQATLTATGSATINWYDAPTGGTLILSNSNSYTTAPLSANATYYAEGVDGFGCTSSGRAAATAIVNTIPASPTTVDDNVCSGSSATLTASGAGTMEWYTNPTGGTSVFTGSNFTTGPLVTTTPYYVQAVDGIGCTSFRATATAFITTGPDGSLTVSPAVDTVCAGANGQITIAASETGVSYQPVIGGTPVGPAIAGNGNTIILTVPSGNLTAGADNIVTIRATRTGCPAVMLTGYSTIRKSTISAPSITAGSGTLLCTGTAVDLSVPSLYPNYQWYMNSALIVGANSPTYNTVTSGVYTLEVSDGLCKSLSPPVNVGLAASDPVITSTGSVLSTTAGAAYYQWYVVSPSGNRAIYGANANSYQVYYNADYFVAVNVNNCRLVSVPHPVNNGGFVPLLKKSFQMTDSTIMILPPLEEEINIALYPNPAQGAFTVDYQTTTTGPVIIELFNSMGDKVLSHTMHAPSPSGIVSAVFSELNIQPGIYLVYIIDADKKVVRSIQIN